MCARACMRAYVYIAL